MRAELMWSTPITNIVQRNQDTMARYHEEFQAFHKARRSKEKYGKAVQWHKAVLGRQAYCFTGWRRYWVWREEDTWRVFVNNVAGIGFEVKREFEPHQAIAAWHSYLRAMDMEDVISL